METQLIGTITALWRYPVKSMQGEKITSAQVSARGIAGDRGYALIETETGNVVSAKHARKWAQVLQCRAEFMAEPELEGELPPVRITLPAGTTLISTDADANERLSALLGRAVKLVKDVPANPMREANRAAVDDLLTQEDIKHEPMAQAAPSGTFFDHAPLHVLTTATLARLQALTPQAQFDVRRFRPNILIAPAAGEGFVENTWLGQALVVADGVTFRLIDPTPRCVITTLPQAELPRQLDVLKTIATHNAAISVTAAPGYTFNAVTGAYAVTEQGGTLAQGMDVRLTAS